MGIEYELKFAATEKQQQQIQRELPGDTRTYQMQTTYYDTPGGDFAAKNCTLRRRMENTVSICTLKTPAQDGGRQEWEVECDTIEGAVEKLCKLGADPALLSLAGEGLVPVCGAQFTRLARTIEVFDGTLELALDHGQLYGGDRTLPLCEVEVEQKTCSRPICTAFAKALKEQYSLTPEHRSKFARALSLYKGE